MAKMSDKNTKAQILDAYNELLTKLQNQANAKHDPAAEVKAKKTAETLASAATTVEQSVEDQIAELQKSMQSVLINLSGSFADKVKEYTTVEEAIAVKKAELKEVHDIEVQAFTLAALVNTQQEIKDKFEVESAEKQEQFAAELDKIKTEIAEAKASYQKELQEEKARLAVERKREQEEYEYNFKREKQRKEDEFNDNLESRRKTFNEEVSETRKELASQQEELDEREEKVSIREEKIDELEAKVAELPNKIAQIKAEAEAAAKAQYDKSAAIKESSIKKHYESEALVYKSQIEMLKEQLNAEQIKVSELSGRLDAAYEKIQSVAIATTQRPTIEYRNNVQNENK